MLNFVLVFFLIGFHQFLLLKNTVVFRTKVYGKESSTSAGDFKISQLINNILYFTKK